MPTPSRPSDHVICEHLHCPQCDTCAGPQIYTVSADMRQIPAIWICDGCELFLHVPGRGWFISYESINARSAALLKANPDLAAQLTAAVKKVKN